MFKKNNRLAKKKDIAQVLEKGRKVFGRALILFFLKNKLLISRATVIVSTKVSKKAVERNKIKRRLREIIKRNKKPGFDLAVVALKSIKDLEYIDVKNDLERLLDRIKI